MIQLLTEAFLSAFLIFKHSFTIGLLMACLSCDMISFFKYLNTANNYYNIKTITTLIETNEEATFQELLHKATKLFQDTENSRILIADQHLTNMKASQVLGKLDLLHAQAKSIIPYLYMDNNSWTSLKRRESNSSDSSFVTNVTDFSNMSASTSYSSLASTHTTVDNQYADTNDYISKYVTDNQQPIYITDAFVERAIQCSSDLKEINTKLCQLDLFDLVRKTHLTKQIYQTLVGLINICISAEKKLDAFQHQPAFIRIAYDTASHAVQMSKEAFAQKLTNCRGKRDFQDHDLQELSFYIDKASLLVSYYLQLQQENTTITDQLLDIHFKMVKFCHDRVEFAFQRADSLRQIIQEGVQQLTAIQYNQQDTILNLMFRVQDIFSSVHGCVTENVQPLVFNLTSSIENNSFSQHSIADGLIQHFVDLIFKDLDIFKTKFYSTIYQLQKTDARASFIENVEANSKHIQQFNIDLCNFIMMDALWSLDTTNKQPKVMQAQLDEYHTRHNDFILRDYNEICSYFTEYDHGLNYQKLGDYHFDLNEDLKFLEELQTHVDRAKVLLNSADLVLQQRRSASRFVEYVSQLQDQKSSSGPDFFLLQKEFRAIKYPMVEIEGLYPLFYSYQRDVYLTLSQLYTSSW